MRNELINVDMASDYAYALITFILFYVSLHLHGLLVGHDTLLSFLHGHIFGGIVGSHMWH